MSLPWADPPGGHERAKAFRIRYRNEQRYRPATVSYFERLPSRNARQPTARVLAKVTNSDLVHVLHSSTSAEG
jgi:hypothetical protein